MDAHPDYSSLAFNYSGPDHAQCERQLRANWLFVKEAIDDGAASKAIAQAFLAGDLNEARHAVQAAVNAHVEWTAKQRDYDWPLIANVWDGLRREEEAPDDKTRALQLIASVNPDKCGPGMLRAVVDVANETLASDIPRPLNPVDQNTGD